MGSDAPTAEELGVDQLAHARFCKTLRFYKSVAARQASLADVALACLLERCTSDFGLWLQLPDHPVYCRLTQAEKHARALSVVAGRYSTPSGELPEATKAKYPAALWDAFHCARALGPPLARAAIGQIERDRSQRPALVGATLFAEDHAADDAEATHSRTRPNAAAPVQRCAAEALGPMRRSLLEHFQLADVTHLHHVAGPHPDGAYAPYVRQARRALTQPLSGKILEGHYVHTPSVPLLATSEGRVELLFVPSILAHAAFWEHALSTEELRTVNRLAQACTSVPSLLMLGLNEYHTVESAIHGVAKSAANWHNGVVHLRWSVHCNKNASAIHNFAGARKKKRNASGAVTDPGAVTLVYSNNGPAHGPKAAFLTWVRPLALVAQAALRQLPAEYFPRVLPSVWRGLELLEGLPGVECSYVSLNIFWSAGLSPRLPNTWRDNAKEHRPLGARHGGLYLHRDNNNDKMGAILVWGAALEGFDQRYVTLSLRLPIPGWSLVIGDFRHLLHCVTQGAGLRFSLVIASHTSTTQGVDEVGREVWAPSAEPEEEE